MRTRLPLLPPFFWTLTGRILCTVVGQEELDSRSVNVRNRDDVGTKARSATIPVAEIVDKLVKLKESRSLKNQFIEA